MIKNFFTSNWKIKLICLVLAIGFWTYVSAIGMRIDNIPGGIQLETRNVSEDFVAIADVNNIEVSVISEKKLWSNISEKSISAYIDCSNLSEGTYELPVLIETDIANIEISSYYPKKVLVRIEKTTSKQVDIRVKIEGELAEGMVALMPEISQEKAIISGPQSIIDNIYEATAVVRMDGESESVKKNVKLYAFDAENQRISNIKFDPERVDVFLPIGQVESVKNVGIKVITDGKIPSDKWISAITTNPSEISIAGSADVLRSLNYIETYPVDINNITSSITKNISLNIPSGVVLLDEIPQISVSIEVQTSEITKEISASILTKNIPSHLKLVTISPPAINTVLSGQKETIENASSTNTKLNLNLGNFSKEGEYYIDISSEMFETIHDLNIINYFPSSIKIILQQK